MLTIPVLNDKTLRTLTKVFSNYPELTEVILYGSRATGKATPRSDIDMATRGILDRHRLGRLAMDLEDTNIPQICDIQAYEKITYAPLKANIDNYGIAIYRANS